MSNPTTPFSWQMPTATDLVTDLPADFEVFGQAVATSMADLLGGTSGQVLAKNSNTDMDFVWIANDQGDITAVTAGTGISGGGTSGDVTITNDMATTITASGDIVVGTGSGTYDNLPIGTTGQILTADTTVSPYKVKWATPSSGGMTVLASGTLSGASLDLTSISSSYTDLELEITNANWATSDDYLILRFNGLSTSIYWTMSQGTNNGGGASAFYGAGAASRMLLWTGTNWTRTGSNNINLKIPNYTATQRRVIFGSIAGQVSGNDNLAYWQGFSTNTGALNQITFSTNSGYTFSSGSYKLWGVK